MLAHIELQTEEYAPRKARNMLGSFALDIPADKFRDAQLVVSELVTNALVYGPEDSTILLRLEVLDNTLQGVVCDEGSGFEVPTHPVPSKDRKGGFGLVIVHKLCSTWGASIGEGFGISFEIRW